MKFADIWQVPARYLKAQAGYDKAETLIAYMPSCAFTSLVKQKTLKYGEFFFFFSGSRQKQLATNEYIFRGGSSAIYFVTSLFNGSQL